MKINVLAIVPTAGFLNIMQKIVSKWETIDLQIIVGNLSEGAEIAGRIGEQYDVIISRGGTAELIRQNCSTPVVEMGISGYDMLRTIMLAQFSGKRSAIVGFPFISSSAEIVNGFFQYQIDIFSVESEEEVRQCLTNLKKDHYMLIIGDVITCDIAGEVGLDSILITAGIETVESAFQRSIEIATACRQYKERVQLVETILQAANQVTLAYTPQKDLVLSTGDAQSKLTILTELPKKADVWELAENTPSLTLFGDKPWHIRKKNIELLDGIYTSFHLRPFPSIPVGNQRGISVQTDEESDHITSENYMQQSKTMAPILNLACRYSQLNYPVVLIGERGVGKDTLAYIMRKRSNHKFAATVMIDSVLINETEWLQLLNDTNSVLFQPNMIYYYRNFEMLAPLLKEKIVKHVNRARSLDNSFHIIAINSDSTICDDNCILPSALNTLHCNTLFLPSLRARQADIPTLVTFFISQLNSQLGTQMVSIEPKAVQRLQRFPWQENLYQLKRIMIELLSMNDTSIITDADVQIVLEKESTGTVISNTNAMLNLNGTLEEIEKRIIHHVLSEECMNHTRTAERLGISRVTLWRKLNDDRAN